jgi:hypothetical protein
MDRVSSAGYQTIGGIRTWQNKNLGAGIQGTTFDQVFMAGVQESVVGAIAKSGQTPTDSALGSSDLQLLNAILAFAGANVQVITSTPGSALPALSAGLVVVNATTGNITITLPASAALGGTVQHWRFARTDATTNTVSIAFHSGDTTLLGGLSGALSLGPVGTLDIVGDGTTHWMVVPSSGVAVFASAGTGNFTVPAGVTLVEADVTGGGAGSGSCGNGQGAGGGGAGGNAIRNCTVTPGQVISVTVGAGGASGIGGYGGNGGTSSFGAFCSATGGIGGTVSTGAGNAPGGPGGLGSGGDINIAGGFGDDGQTFSAASFGGVGGSGRWGGGGRAALGGGSPAAGQAPGSGAGGSYGTASNGEQGAVGIVIVRWKS